MKTNHQRGFKSDRGPRAVYRKYHVFAETVISELSDKAVGAIATCGDHTNGKRGIAKDRKGAKKYINSRTRFHENQALKRISSNLESDDD
jgi:hypothetical protein